ncbi:MAG: LLM class flavin-dependent oxidoreductase [Asgard group archaeon]|nr:LLM class flavin-dependent oxidoreductase [Asgard group archaeon]
MKFGYYVRSELNYPAIRDLTIRVEKMGFDSAHVNDHLIGFDEKQEKKEPYLEALMLMSALAAETEKIKLGHIVLCNSFRNPAHLAKSISTLDNISKGRALLWLGAGWYEEEYKAYGYSFPTPKRRVDELEESLTIIKKLFTEDSTDFAGEIWILENNRNFPKPVQKPYPPIVLGTLGKRMTKIACREADGINLPYTKYEDLALKVNNINELLSSFDRNPNKFEISLFTDVTLVDNQEELETEISKIIGRNKEGEKPTKEEVLKNRIIGFPEDIKEKITQINEIGIERLVFTVRKLETTEDPLKLFHEKIM